MPLRPILLHLRCLLHSLQLVACLPSALAVDCGVLPYMENQQTLSFVRQVGSSGNSPEAAGLAIPVQIAPLNFSVDQYIAIGSPLGLFLALRKVLQVHSGYHITLLLTCRACSASLAEYKRAANLTRAVVQRAHSQGRGSELWRPSSADRSRAGSGAGHAGGGAAHAGRRRRLRWAARCQPCLQPVPALRPHRLQVHCNPRLDCRALSDSDVEWVNCFMPSLQYASLTGDCTRLPTVYCNAASPWRYCLPCNLQS
jgi:hypothetical protein